MPINILDNLIHDQSEGLTDDDVHIEDGLGTGLETLSPAFFSFLVSTGLVTDNGDQTDTYAESVGVASSGTDWITVTGESDINTLVFAADSSGAALDGDAWTDGGAVLTADTGEQVYLYAVEGGTLLIGSTLSLADLGGVAPTSLSDFDEGGGDYSNLVIAAYLDAETDFTSAEVYYTSFRPVVNPNPNADDADYVDLADNVWLYGDSSQVLTFSGLDPQKFLFGIAGSDDPSGPSTKIFVLGENYMVDNQEEPVNGPTAQKLNTSSAGKFWQFPDIEDIATVGVHNQSVNVDQGIFVMLMNTADPVGNYQDGDDADNLVSDTGEAILKQTQMGFGIVQAVGNKGIVIEITGYDSGFTSGADLIQSDDTSLGQGTPEGIETVTISWIDGDGGTIYQDTVDLDGLTVKQLNLNGRIVTITPEDLNGDGDPTKIVLSNVASQDLITVDWTDEVDHALLHTNSGAIDWGIVAGSFGNPFSANVGANMLYDDDGPVASVSVGTEPGIKYLFDGNFDYLEAAPTGNYEGNNGFNLPTGDELTPDGPNSVTVNFASAFTTSHDYGTDGGDALSTTYTWDGPTIDSAVMMSGSQATSGGTGLIWKTTTGGYAAVLSSDGTTEIFTITRTGAMVTFTLKGPLDQPNADNSPITADVLTLDNGQIGLKREDTITDNDLDEDDDDATVDLGGNFGVGDDAPIVDVTTQDDDGKVAALGVNLDETIDPDNDQTANGADNYAASENESTSAIDPGPYVPPAGNGDLDDVVIGSAANTPVYLEAPVGSIDADGATPVADSQAIGKLESTAGQITALFSSATASTSIGADGGDTSFGSGGISDSLEFDLSLDGVATNLIATPVVGSEIASWSEAQRTVHLFEVTDTDGDVTVIEGRVDGPGADDEYVILRMTLTNKDDPANATIVYENFAPVQHGNTALQDETIPLLIPETAGETPVQETLSIVYTVGARDKDLDTASDSESVVLIDDGRTILEIDDDGPGTVTGGPPVDLFEDALSNGRTDGPSPIEVVRADGSLADQVDGGSDGAKDFGWVTAGSAEAIAFLATLNGVYTSGGDPVVWSIVNGETREVPDTGPPADTATADVLYAKVNGTDTILEVIIFGNGTYEMILSGPFDHDRALPNQDDNDTFTIDFTGGLQAVEGDNDPVVFQANALRARIEDDAPLAGFDPNSAEPAIKYLFDGNYDHDSSYGNFEGNNGFNLPTGDATANGPNTVDVDFSGVFNSDHDFGADGEGSTTTTYSLVLDGSVTSGVTQVEMNSGTLVHSGGTDVIWHVVDSQTVEARAGTDVIFKIEVNNSGVVTFTQTGVLDHPSAETSPVYTDDILTLDGSQVSVRRTDNITDADNDPSSAYAQADLGGNFGIGDDAPVADVGSDGTEPGVQYLYDGNFDHASTYGNFEGSPDNTPPTADVTPTADATANGPNTVMVDYSGAFTTDHDAGADGQKTSTPAYTLALGVLDGSDVTMTDHLGSTAVTSGDVDVVWEVVNATTIRAVTDEGTPKVIFTISVNGTTGVVTFTQTGVLDHRREDDHNTSVHTSDILTLDDGQVSLKRTDTVVDNDDDEDSDFAVVDLGGNFGIGDDAPDLGTLTDVPTLAFIDGDEETVTDTLAYGADGAGTYKIVGSTTPTVAPGSVLGTISYDIALDGQSITYSYDSDGAGGDPAVDFLLITLNDPSSGDYTAEVLESAPLVKVGLFSGGTLPGGPVEHYTPLPPGDIVTFDGFIADDWDASEGNSLKYQFQNGGDRGDPGEESEGFSDEDINIDSNGIGLENAIMNATEALAMFFTSGQAGVEIVFDGSTGGLSTFQIRIEAWNGDTLVEVYDDAFAHPAPKGPNQYVFEWTLSSGTATDFYLSISLEGNDAIRIPEISAYSFANVDDLSATVTVELEDFDGDTDRGEFDWMIDADGTL